jgi:cytoskeletal protein RodZ
MAADRNSGDFGSKLREARERRGISLRQIANATKISVSALEALERGDISRLPGGIFSRAFVRSYATEVGLDPEQMTQQFMAEFPHDSVTAGHPASTPTDDHETHESNRQTATTFLRIIAISLPIAAAVIYWARPGRTAPERVADVAAPAAAVVREAPPLAPPSPPVAGTSEPAPAAVAAAAAPGAGLSVGVVATGPCWISAIVDGERRVAREFQAGERVSFDAQRDIVLTAGDAAAVAVTLNGEDARRLGAAGQVVTVRLTPANFRDYLAAP